MRFGFVTLFEGLISGYFEHSILKRAVENGIIETYFLNPTNYSKDRFKRVDNYQAGGGAGMVMKCEPFFDLLEEAEKRIIHISSSHCPQPKDLPKMMQKDWQKRIIFSLYAVDMRESMRGLWRDLQMRFLA
jgi:tRNA (guanine-N1)-methyltransferase